MKKLLNPKLAQKKITVIEYSYSQEELEDNEDLNEKRWRVTSKLFQKIS